MAMGGLPLTYIFLSPLQLSHSSLTKDIEVGMPQSGRGEGKKRDFSRRK
jgi:hypothetical protein